MQFEPFQDRLSRDIRNDLSESLSVTLSQLDITPVQNTAQRYLSRDIDQIYQNYISDRIDRYGSALARIKTGSADTFWKALVLWDLSLFFEVHEILEKDWIRASGSDKLVLQAMIRSAGVYIKLEYGYVEAARKMARRALPVLEAHRVFLSGYFDPDPLLRSLDDLDPVAPRLLTKDD